MFLGSGHRVTGEFRRSQIVTPVAAECIARMGRDHPLYPSPLKSARGINRVVTSRRALIRAFFDP